MSSSEPQKDGGKDKNKKPSKPSKPKTKSSNETSGDKGSNLKVASDITSANDKGPGAGSSTNKHEQSLASPDVVLENYLEKLRDENKKFMQDFMSQMKSEMISQAQNSSTVANSDQATMSMMSSSTQPQANLSNKFDHVNEEAARDDDLIVHAGPLEDLEELNGQHDQDSQKIGSEEDVGTCSVAGTLLSDSRNPAEDIQWVSVLKQLPSYYDNLIDDKAEAQTHTSFVAKAFQKPQGKHSVPKLPLDGMMKEKWDNIEKYLKSGNVSPVTSVISRRFVVNEEDFEKYSRVPKVDPEYTALVGSKSKPSTQSSFSSISQKGSSGVVRDKDLRIAENEFQKCDESARVIFRAASHGSLIVNAMHTIMNDPDKYQMDEALNLLHGAFMAFESIADCALRATARSILARRRIYLSQVTFKDSNAQKDLMQLPMDGKNLFHGEFSEVMHKYATIARDARETSDYASSKFNAKKRAFPGSSSGGSFPPNKKPAFTKGQAQVAGSQGPGQLTVSKQSGQQERKVSFKSPFPKNRNAKQSPFFKKGSSGGGFRQ